MQQKIHVRLIFTTLISLLVFSSCLDLANSQLPDNLNVGFIGLEYDEWQQAPVLAALQLDPSFNITIWNNSTTDLNFEDFLNQVDFVVIQDWVLSQIELNLLKSFIHGGHGISIWSGPRLTENNTIFHELGILNSTQTTESSISNAVPKLQNDSIILNGVDWNSVSDIENYTLFPMNNISSILVDKEPREDSVRTIRDPLIFIQQYGEGRALIYSVWVENRNSFAFAGSSFFNYFAYSGTITQAGLLSEKHSYQEWQYSPIPHSNDQIWIWGLILGAFTIASLIVTRARKRSKLGLLDTDLAALTEKPKEQENKEKEGTDEENIQEPLDIDKIDAWERIGLHKQISGFFTSLVLALLVAGPQILLILFVYPRYVMPFPQAGGNFAIVKDLFAAVWLVLDIGTSVALVTFFSAHRVEEPDKAVHYIQIYIFWQLLTGILQFTVVALLSMYYFPGNLKYAHLSFHFLVHSMIQFPGFLSVMLLTLRALQRSDLEQIAILLLNFVIKILVSYGAVIVCRTIFKDFVEYGEIFGALVGLNIGDWIGAFMEYFFAGYLFKKAGYKGNLFFRWDFSMEEVKEVLVYGLRIILGNVWVPAVATLQAVTISNYVSDYASEFAYYNLAYQITAVISLIGMLTDTLQSPIAEAYAYKEKHNKEMYLARVYVSSFKWVNFLNYFLASVLFVVGGRLILSFSGPTWERAVFYLNGLIIFQVLGAYSWIGDKFMLGCNKANIIMYIWIIEQGVRALGLVFFIPRFGMWGVILAYIPGLLTKDILLIFIIRKKIIAPKWYFWQVWITPLIAAVINYLVLESLATVFWDGGILTTILLFFIGVLGSINLYGFITGYLGAWDKNQLKELKMAVDLSKKGLNLMALMIYKSATFGAKLRSPFVGKSEIDIWDQAQVEIDALQRMKKKLVM